LQAVAVEVEQLKAKLVEAEASAGKKAQEALAAIGHPAVEQPSIAAPDKPVVPTNRAEAEKQLAALSKADPAQAREFYLKHKPLLTSKG
jgi:hypothetical protein